MTGDAEDVRGRYHPCWVGHRTLASTVADQTRFWTALAAGELCDLDVLTQSVEIGFDAPGFHRPSYGLGVMTDPRPRRAADRPRRRRPGLRGGGVRAAAPAGRASVVVLLSADERADVQREALNRL